MSCRGVFSGIYPNLILKHISPDVCCHCNQFLIGPISICDCDIYDYLHDKCIDEFVLSEKGKIILEHNHLITRRPPPL